MQSQFTGSEAMRFVRVSLELVGGISARAFSVTINPSEKSPVSAQGNDTYMYKTCLTNVN